MSLLIMRELAVYQLPVCQLAATGSIGVRLDLQVSTCVAHGKYVCSPLQGSMYGVRCKSYLSATGFFFFGEVSST